MASLRSLLRSHRSDALVAWLSAAVLAGSAGRFLLLGEPDWAVLALCIVAVVLVVPVHERDPATTFPGELVATVSLPVVVRAVGLAPTVTPFLAVAGLAVLVAVALDAFTSLSMTPRFAVVFVVVTTMAFAGAWAVAAFAADRLLGTAFLTDKTELMWDLVGATGVGVVAGVVFDQYFEYSARVDHLREDADRESTAPEGPTTSSDGDRRARLATRALQFGLVGISGVALLRRDPTLLVNSGGPLAVTLLPALFRREYGYRMHGGLVLWLALASTLHAVGAVGLYQSLGWYDSLTHTLSATLVAGVGYAVARAVEDHTGAVSFDREFRATFVVLFVLAVGVGWEILEFASGGLATLVGGEAVLAQYGTTDIVNDLVFNTVGAVVVALWSSSHFEGVATLLTDRVGALARREE
ncbi:hypothetical protein EGH21_07005 [Halomicroarcula sp. F13]|uniref:Uncharacterized protein n=1 Tax=Haloarcula rubra TaxID=2487747 RepID=A0AAW4PNT0_9EURY|nr:hypothetical protein [Halomicroarcula rubra]MBX0322776.1 hypothetical protein [Halomicroarcula rubra]